MRGWLDYWRAVGGRISWDRGLLRGLWIVPWLQLSARRQRPAARGHIAYYPQPAGPWYTLPLALAGTSIRQTSDHSRADAVMMFDDRTQSDPLGPKTGAQLINARATDISKDHVADIFEQVFGYPLAVDPTIHTGPMVQKSDVNGVHDGAIVEGPIPAPKPDCVYQHLVDSTVRDGVTEDLRCVCVGGDIVLVFRKEKADRLRFSTSYLQTTLRDANGTFSKDERQKIARFCDAMGLDFGSIDVLRDYSKGGRPYIVDVNKTCMPVLSMPAGELAEALRRIGAAAENFILTTDPPRV